ncbi:MAG: hypothetical protein QW273_00865 [Candidatus Pacearchaeota archaeon]
MRDKKAQVWIETVIYTLIGLSIISLLLIYAKPKIEEVQDKIAIESVIDLFNKIDYLVLNVMSIEGNRRVIEINVPKGVLTIDAKNDEIVWKSFLNYKYSESDVELKLGRISILTSGNISPYEVKVKLNYTNINITINEKEEVFDIGETKSLIKITFTNKGNRNLDVIII